MDHLHLLLEGHPEGGREREREGGIEGGEEEEGGREGGIEKWRRQGRQRDGIIITSNSQSKPLDPIGGGI